VGFPGETDAEFQETIDVAREVGFSKIHIFPFSARRGTPAATMPNQVPAHVQQCRARELARVESELRDRYYRRLLGRRLRVLVETGERGARSEGRDSVWSGTSCRYATVELPATTSDEGSFLDVTATEVRGDRIVAQ
jgi:threonylcarbamoyladenosine tRNA methylthiotransferase MtaB